MIPSSALQDALVLLTVAMDADSHGELGDLVEEFRAKNSSDDLLLAVVALCRALCLATSKLIHVLDDELSDEQASLLTDDELLPVAMDVVRAYGRAAANS